MQVFLSWSGERSKLIAEAIRGWLPKVIQSVKPWMSDEDISAGSRWLSEVSNTLNNAKVGIICITPENQHNPWLLFEAGALSKTLEQTCVCPLVFGLTPGQLSGPITQFQANQLDRDGILKIITTLNKSISERNLDSHELEEIVDVWWPKLKEKLDSIPENLTPTISRTSSEQLEELLQLSREQLRRENIRLESIKERDDKVDKMIELMEHLALSVTSQSSMLQKNLQGSLKAVTSKLYNSDMDTDDDLSSLFKSISSKLGAKALELDTAPFSALTKHLREMQDSDKKQIDLLLTGEQAISNLENE